MKKLGTFSLTRNRERANKRTREQERNKEREKERATKLTREQKNKRERE